MRELHEIHLFEVLALFGVIILVSAFILSAVIYYCEGGGLGTQFISKTVVVKDVMHGQSYQRDGFIDTDGNGYYLYPMLAESNTIISKHIYNITYYCSATDNSRKVFRIKDISLITPVPTPTPVTIPTEFVCKNIDGKCE
jgi:hypothetical protein